MQLFLSTSINQTELQLMEIPNKEIFNSSVKFDFVQEKDNQVCVFG